MTRRGQVLYLFEETGSKDAFVLQNAEPNLLGAVVAINRAAMLRKNRS
ncbi:MAG: hypothetical protein HY308_06305 [Gammaproteobacteria bacterium]|nr:hypothetical protein [Gammaproteobacteria bacterium]